MPLTDTAIRNAKPGQKARKLFDGGGLFLLVTPAGAKLWRLKYRFHGKEKLLSLGSYPDVPLAGRKDKRSGEYVQGARDKRDAARTLIAQDIDPSLRRKTEKRARAVAGQNTFEIVAREWFKKHSPAWSNKTAAEKLTRLEKRVFPVIGARPIQEITRDELLDVLRRIEERPALEVARRMRQALNQVYRYAVATGRCEANPASDLREVLPPPSPRHHAALTEPRAIGGLLRAIRGYDGEPVTIAALQLAPLLFVRPGELRAAEWGEIDLDDAIWRIPGSRMKGKADHLVPLAEQAIEILESLNAHTGRCQYVFPSIRSRARPMSENTLNAALRRLGYTRGEMTTHGFRTMASTLLNELGWNRDAIERQLAHSEKDSVRAAYNRAEYLPERREMMQSWADYLDQLAAGADVVLLKQKRDMATRK